MTSNRSKVIKRLDDKARENLKRVYPLYCVTCGKGHEWYHPQNNTFGIQVSHYISRDIKQLRWDSRNIHPMCTSCNLNHNKNKLRYREYLADIYSWGVVYELEEIERKAKAEVVPIPISQLEEWFEEGMKALL